MKDSIYTIVTGAVLVLGIILVVGGVTRCDGKKKDKVTTDTVYITDTLYYPKLDSIEVTKYITKYLPTTPDTITKDSIIRDTVEVEIPISKYQIDTTVNQANLKAEIEGFAVEMNNLSITYPTASTTVIKKPKSKRWGVGIQVGYGVGVSDNKITGSPYIGLGISWNILTF